MPPTLKHRAERAKDDKSPYPGVYQPARALFSQHDGFSLVLFGIAISQYFTTTKDALEAVEDLQDELNMRPHLRNPKIFWETDTHRAIIQVDDEDLDAESSSNGIAEEILEVATAVLQDFKRIHVEVLDMYPSKS